MLLFFLVVLILIILILLFSSIQIFIKEFEIDANTKEITKKYDFKIGIYFLGKIKIFSIKLNNNNVSKFFNKGIIKNTIKLKFKDSKQLLKNKNTIFRSNIIKLMKKIKIRNLDLSIYFDTSNILFTSYLVPVISTILSVKFVEIFNKNNNKFTVVPIYNNNLHICITLNCIIEIKVIHIINMLTKIGGIKNERSSNRRFNINSDGKHKKYGRC